MKKNLRPLVLIIAISLSAVSIVYAWGSWGHQRINRAAVFALPQEMRPFFYNHIDFITEEAVVPDLRKYGAVADKNEGPRHYIDIEDFNVPIAALPKTTKEATTKYDDKFLQKTGTLPWVIQDVYQKLMEAFKGKRKTEILFLAGDLGHYVGDAHMPLHTSTNHDGQLTDQKGIHAFWESQLPEMFGNAYNFNTPEAQYIDNITDETWRIITHTHMLVDSVLMIEKKLSQEFPKQKMYMTDATGTIIKNKYNQSTHSAEYSKAFHDRMNGMVESQLRLSIQATANFWYTAWVNAGKPDLGDLDPAELTNRNKKNLKKEYRLWTKGKLLGLKTEKEF